MSGSASMVAPFPVIARRAHVRVLAMNLRNHRSTVELCPGVVSVWLLALAIGLNVSSAGCSGNSPKSAEAEGPGATPVKLAVAQSVAVDDTSEYVATLKSRESAVIMPQVEGQIIQIFVHSGDHVGPSTPLMQIDPAKQQATVKTQQNSKDAQFANLKWAQQQYDRTSGLYAAGVISKQDLDQAKTALDAAQAQLHALDAQVQEQEVQLHYYRVTGGASGIVGDIPVRVGDRVTSTTMLTTVDKPGTLEAYVYVPVERSSQLKLGMPVHLVDGEGNLLGESRVSFISPQVDSTTQTVLVKARIANSNDKLRTAQFIRARVVWGTHLGPVVPVLAVSRIGGQYFAFVAEEQNGKLVARQKPLRLGEMVGNNYVVLDGIKPGDKIVVSGTQFLVDGAPVVPQS